MFDTLRSYWRTAIADIRYQGWEVLGWRIAVKLLSPLLKLDLQILFDLDLTRPLPDRPPRPGCTLAQAAEGDIDEILDMQLRRLTPEELATLPDDVELQYAQMLRVRAKAYHAYVRQLRAGEQCYTARVDGTVAHSNWIRFHDNDHPQDCPVALAPGEVYTTDAYTADPFRGQGLHEVVLTHMLRVAQRRGCHRAYTITDLTKAGSRRGVKRIGWRRRGMILFVKPRGLNRTWLVRVGGDLEPLFAHARAVSQDG